MRSAIAYVRVSTDRQGISGFGLDAQLVQIRQFAKDRGYRIIKIYREIASAMGRQTPSLRPELSNALEFASAT